VGAGSNFAIGGKVLAPNHIDAMVKDTTIYFDGKIVMDNGKMRI
jgi:leucyl aminopeptidase (aminopeptidase T)